MHDSWNKGTGLCPEPRRAPECGLKWKGFALDSGSGVMWRLDDELARQVDG